MVDKKRGLIRFHFGPHNQELDFERRGLSKVFKNAKQLYIELVTQPEQRAAVLRDIEHLKAGGRIEELKALAGRNSFQRRFYQELSGIRAATHLEPSSDMLFHALSRETVKMSLNRFMNGDLENAIRLKKIYLDRNKQTEGERNEAIRISLEELSQKHPGEPIDVIIGGGHSIIARDLRKAGFEVETNRIPQTFSIDDELVRREHFNKKLTPEKEREMVAKSLVENLVDMSTEEDKTRDSVHKRNVVRKIANRLSVEDVSEISKYLRKQEVINAYQAMDLTVHWLKKHGKIKEGEL